MMPMLSHARAKLVAGLTIVAISLGASAMASPASAAPLANCSIATTSPFDYWTQCQVYHGSVQLSVWCTGPPFLIKSEWIGPPSDSFLGANVRRSSNPAGFKPLRCLNGVAYHPRVIAKYLGHYYFVA